MTLEHRSQFIHQIFEIFVSPTETILEIGDGTGRNVEYLKTHGYPNVVGIDKMKGSAIEDVPPVAYDVIFTMSTLFLIPPENDWVFAKIAKMAKRMIITLEGEVTSSERQVWGRNYQTVFEPLGFTQILHQEAVFNWTGHLRVFKKTTWKK